MFLDSSLGITCPRTPPPLSLSSLCPSLMPFSSQKWSQCVRPVLEVSSPLKFSLVIQNFAFAKIMFLASLRIPEKFVIHHCTFWKTRRNQCQIISATPTSQKKNIKFFLWHPQYSRPVTEAVSLSWCCRFERYLLKTANNMLLQKQSSPRKENRIRKIFNRRLWSRRCTHFPFFSNLYGTFPKNATIGLKLLKAAVPGSFFNFLQKNT